MPLEFRLLGVESHLFCCCRSTEVTIGHAPGLKINASWLTSFPAKGVLLEPYAVTALEAHLRVEVSVAGDRSEHLVIPNESH
jgi:hypothetical protein